MLQLYIGNKNYSSWSMRSWVLLRQLGVDFAEVRLRFDEGGPDSAFRKAVQAVSPAGRVPVLVDDGIAVWDTMAIAEYVAERHPDRRVWPAATRDRARARSVCAEMHSGFAALRRVCPFNVEASLATAGALVWRDDAGLRADVGRLVAMWEELLAASGGPLLFGEFSNADACFAPVCLRLVTYALPVSDAVAGYVRRVLALSAVDEWVRDALAEGDFLVFEEPYRLQR